MTNPAGEHQPSIPSYSSAWSTSPGGLCLLAVGILLLLVSLPRLMFPDLVKGPQFAVWAVLFFGIGIVGNWLRHHFGDLCAGSSVDYINRELVWWYGSNPPVRHWIKIDEITSVGLPNDEDRSDVAIRVTAGTIINVPAACFDDPKKWAETMCRGFPHIKSK